jgi:hypothetical protein
MILFAIPLLFFVCTVFPMDHNEPLEAEPSPLQRANPSLAMENLQDSILELSKLENNQQTWYKATMVDGDYILATISQDGMIHVDKWIQLVSGMWHCTTLPNRMYYTLKYLYEQLQGNGQ